MQMDYEKGPRSDAAAVRAVDGSYQAAWELIQRVWQDARPIATHEGGFVCAAET